MNALRKIAALICALALAASLCGCAFTDEEAEDIGPNEITEPAETEPEPEEPKVEPPIEVSRFCEPDDMPEADFAELDDETYAIEADGETYTLRWLYDHNIYDWRTAGITFDQVNERTKTLLGLDYSDEAFEAIKKKVSDFTELMVLKPAAEGEAAAGVITVTTGDETVDYDIEWLSSHNATDYTAAGIDADTVSAYLDAIYENYWYTREYRWIEVVHDRLVNGF